MCMVKNKFLFAILTFSLSCFAQNSSTAGVSTSAQPVGADGRYARSPFTPIVVPGEVTLPGSGPPVGAPIGNENSNDARTGGAVQVYNPTTVTDNGTAGAEVNNGAAISSAALPVNTGMQNFAGELPSEEDGAASLGEIARQYRAQSHQVARVITNEAINKMNAAQPISVATPQRDMQREMAMASALPPVTAESAESALPQNDGGMAGSASQNSSQASAIDQQRRSRSARARSTDQTPANSNAESAASQPEQNEANGTSDHLPASSSSLPLLGLVGFLVLGGGTVYLLRR